MKFTLYTADCVGSLTNSIYPHKCVITDEVSMKSAVEFDHVAAEYTNNHRSSAEFLSADNIPMDCDNDHSDNPNDWVTPLEVAMAFPGVEFVVVYSRNRHYSDMGAFIPQNVTIRGNVRESDAAIFASSCSAAATP